MDGRSPAAAARVEVIGELPALERLAPAWDALAEAQSMPSMLSGWQLAWWRHVAPAGAALRAVAVHDGGRLAAIAPYYAMTARDGRVVYDLLAAPITQRTAPLLDGGGDGDGAGAAALIATALRELRPRPYTVLFDGVDAERAPHAALRRAWPGRRPPWLLVERTLPGPALHLRHESFDAWLASKSSNFRQQVRRFRRRLSDAGGRVRLSDDPAAIERDVEAFMRLHQARWEGRGETSLTGPVGAMLRDAAASLAPSGRLRLWIVELQGRPIGAQLFLAAGDTVTYWNGGFDAEFDHLKPALLGIVAGVEDCFARGARLLDLGAGDHDYKLRIADHDRPVAWAHLVPHGRGYARGRLALLSRQVRAGARRLLRR